jgi:hypothetical protein
MTGSGRLAQINVSSDDDIDVFSFPILAFDLAVIFTIPVLWQQTHCRGQGKILLLILNVINHNTFIIPKRFNSDKNKTFQQKK